MATLIWDQSDFNPSQIALGISNTLIAVDFVLSADASFDAASVWLTDDYGYEDDGVLNTFSGEISWGIFYDNAGNGPGALIASGLGLNLTQADTGQNFGSQMDIVRVDFSLENLKTLVPGTYWFALREGEIGDPDDGSNVFWLATKTTLEQEGWFESDGTTPGSGWIEVGSLSDYAFQLWSARPGTKDDTETMQEDATVSIDVLSNDIYDSTIATITVNNPSHGSAKVDDKGTPDASDDRIIYTPDADYFGSDSFTYTLTMGGWVEAATVDITINAVNDAPVITSNAGGATAALDVSENTKAVTTVTASDVNAGDTLTYSISGGDDADAFVIDPVTGQLTFAHLPDFEWPGSAAGTNSYLVEVSVSDGKSTTAKTFEINVTDVDEPHVVGTLEDDQFSASDTPTHFIGLSGLDAVTFSGPASDYAIEHGPYGTIYVTGPDGTDTLSSIERLQFDDGTLAFDTNGTAGQVFRLYQAVFGREPDPEGLGYWIQHQDAGQSSFPDVARSFMASPEFEQRYGSEDSLSNATFIDLLYQNVLGRDPDDAGFAYWADKLDTGQTNFGDLLAFFSDSKENIAGTADAVSDGIWFV